jgi:hypothetical protein
VSQYAITGNPLPPSTIVVYVPVPAAVSIIDTSLIVMQWASAQRAVFTEVFV